jgi:hypothetical protein
MPTKIKGKVDLAGIVTKDGEFIPLELTLSAFIPRNPRDKEPYTKVYGEKVLEAIRDKKLRASELEVFLWFIAKNSNKDSWNNEWINVDYKDLADELGFRKETVQRAIKTLLKLKFIVQWKPRKTVFRLNPDYCFRGGVIGKVKAVNEILDSHLEKGSRSSEKEDNQTTEI